MNSNTIGALALLHYEQAIAKLVLATVIEATPALGRPPSRSFVASVLTGSVRRDLVAADAHRLSTFGIFARHGMDACCTWIDRLVVDGYLEVVTGRRGIVCTMTGRAVLMLEEVKPPKPFGLIDLSVDADALDLAVRSGLIEALRRYRAEQASQLEVPEYRLFSEATLRQIGTVLPATIEQVQALPGVGPKRAAESGAALLRLVAEHRPIIERLRPVRSVTVPLNSAGER
jgi:ATP-dependent DNA helicase RecQ